MERSHYLSAGRGRRAVAWGLGGWDSQDHPRRSTEFLLVTFAKTARAKHPNPHETAMEISLAAREDNPTSLAQLDPDVLYSPEELAEPAAALVAKMSLEEEASLC